MANAQYTDHDLELINLLDPRFGDVTIESRTDLGLVRVEHYRAAGVTHVELVRAGEVVARGEGLTFAAAYAAACEPAAHEERPSGVLLAFRGRRAQ